MTFLYSCRHEGDQYRITKLTYNLEVESSYLCTADECECPAGVRPSCRHRDMLPRFIHRGAVGTGWMYDFDRGGWVDNRTDEELNPDPLPDGEHVTFEPMPPLPAGVQVVFLDSPAELHNAIAEAVGEAPMPFVKKRDGRRA